MTKPGPQCHVCRHREVAAINLALARGVSITALSRRYKVSLASLYRHGRRPACMPPQLRASLIAGPSLEGVDLDKVRETESQSLLMHLINLRNRLFAALDTAEEAGDGGMLSRVAGQIHHNLEVTGKLLGDLGVGTTTINNILIQPAYVEMRVELVRALAPFPEARQAVATVLHAMESKAADAVSSNARELAS